MSKQKSELTVEAVTKVVQDGKLTSLTQVSKALGLGTGSVSGSVAKRLRELVPTIDAMLAANKDAKGGKKTAKPSAEGNPAGKPQAAAPQDDGERLCPFRLGSKYAAIWLSLWRHRKSGITRKALIEEITASSKDFSDPKTASFAVTVVASPTKDGGAHKSASRAADHYWVEKAEGGNLKLHLRDGKA